MATQFYSDQIQQLFSTTAGGLQGAPKLARNQEVMGGLQIWRFSYTVPASGAPIVGDVIDLAYLKPTARIYGIFIRNSDWGTGQTFSIGRVDPNNSSNNDDDHYVSGLDMASARTLVINEMLLAGSQVGDDNKGDLSTGNVPPAFGAAPVIIQGKFGGVAPDAGSTLDGWIEYVEGDQA